MTTRNLLTVLLIAALAAGAGFFVDRRDDGAVSVRHVRGVTVAVGNDGTAIGLARDGEREGHGYDIRGVQQWQDCTHGCGPWVMGRGVADCVPNLSSGQQIELGVVTTAPEGDIAGVEAVVWLRCLSAPAHVATP